MNKYSFPFSIEPWTLITENKEYKTPIFELLSRKFRLESEDHEGKFYILNAPEWINVIALTPEKEIILVEQYRYGIQEPTLEIPGGMVDEGETPLEASKRELLEETGYMSSSWIEVGRVSSNPAILDNYTHCFVAENCVFKGTQNQNSDQHERINVHKLPLRWFFDKVRDGTVHHAIVLAGVALYLLEEKYFSDHS